MPELYPIIIRGDTRTRLVKIAAESFGEAKERALMKYRNKFVNYKHAKAMDLIEARVEAATKSRKGGKPVYVVCHKDEFKLEVVEPKNKDDIYGLFVNGSEDKEYLKNISAAEPTANKAKVDAPTLSKGATNGKVMATEAAKKPAKKAAKKVAKKEASADLWHKGLTAKATTLRFSKSQWDQLYKKAEENGGIQKMAHDALIAKFGLGK